MGFFVKIGGRLRRISAAEAKYRRAKGQSVIDTGGEPTESNLSTPPEPPAIVEPESLDPLRYDAQGDPAIGSSSPRETPPADPPLMFGNGGAQGVDCDLCEESIEHPPHHAVVASTPAELTDAELELLTAPEPPAIVEPEPEPTRIGRRRRSQRED